MLNSGNEHSKMLSSASAMHFDGYRRTCSPSIRASSWLCLAAKSWTKIGMKCRWQNESLECLKINSF